MDITLSASLAVNSLTEMSHLPFFINFIKQAKNATKELYKKLGGRLNRFKDSRCYPVSQCISMLTPGSNNVVTYLEVWLANIEKLINAFVFFVEAR